MSSSEKFSGGRSNFSQTCSLLSQYLKEKGSFGELTLGLTPNLAAESKGTMNLLPKIEESGETPSPATGNHADELSQLCVAGEESLSGSLESGQMTIFYGGQVLVFNDFPSEKAKEIMMLAGKSSAAKNNQNAAFTAPNTIESATGLVSSFLSLERASQPALPSNLPITRKHSLARFLAKRKDRIAANAPYQVRKLASAAQDEPWLAAPQRPPGH